MGSNTVYSSDGNNTVVDPELAEKLDIEDDPLGDRFSTAFDDTGDYVRHCGCSDYTECGHLEGMTPHELRQYDDFAGLTHDQINRLLQWLRDEADVGHRYDGADIRDLRLMAETRF